MYLYSRNAGYITCPYWHKLHILVVAVLYIVTGEDGAILRPLKQHFSHIKTMGE